MSNISRQHGNVLFLILIAVALFAALAYAITQSSRGGGDISKEKLALEQARMDSYMASINAGTLRLKMAGCETIDYTPPVDWTAGEKKCFLFHPQGGQVIYQDMGLNDCDLQGKSMADLAIGEGCGGVIFIGSAGGRLYVRPTDQGAARWDTSSPYVTTGATSTSDGKGNTDLLVAAGSRYAAANICRAMGPDWYLPSSTELTLIYNNRIAAKIDASLSNMSYWSSTQTLNHTVGARNMVSGASNNLLTKNSNAGVRCVRGD